MVYDVVVLCTVLVAIYVAWYMKISIDLLTILVMSLSCLAVYWISPYMVSFATNSTTDFATEFWYLFGGVMGFIIVLAVWMILKSSIQKHSLINRLLGTLVFGLLIFMACGIILLTLNEYTVISMAGSKIVYYFHSWREVLSIK